MKQARKRKLKAIAIPESATAPLILLILTFMLTASLLWVIPVARGASPEELAAAATPVIDDAPVSGQLPESAAKARDDEHPDAKATGAVAAMDAKKGRAVHVGELVTAGAEPWVLIGRRNQRVELSPRSVAEFDGEGSVRLLRGSALVDSSTESSVRTAGARVEFVGKVLVSYDHAEKSSSAFVLDGEARLVNSHRDDSSVRLKRFRGATLVVGEILPQLIRQLDVAGMETWLKGYSWPEARRKAVLENMPGQPQVARAETPKHLEEAKIEDYFSSIDTADEFHQPDYYEKKFDDPDKVVAEQNSKAGVGKQLSPEEAALISLPKTQIDLGFELGPEFLTADQKKKEVARVEPPSKSVRAPASVAKKVAVKAVKNSALSREQGDPDVSLVLQRLRAVRNENAEISRAPEHNRAPSSVPQSVVPDPVYDYSQNF
jgi:hypothetical protein